MYFGNGLYGVEAASLGYFGKHAADLDVSEAALLAGLVKAPSAYAPTVSMERAVMRRNVTLEAMRNTGAIDEATYREAAGREVRLRDLLHVRKSTATASRRKSESGSCSGSDGSAFTKVA